MLDFTFCPVQLTLGEDLRHQILDELARLEPSAWYHDDFRTTRIAALRTGGGHAQKGQVAQNTLPMAWTALVKTLPRLKYWLDDQLLSVTGPDARIFLLRTEARAALPVHIDCALRETTRPQLKFRYVLQGDPASLFFVESDGEGRRFMTGASRSYLMDGGHPHGVDNPCDEAKITLCVGSPWSAQDFPEELLNFSQRLQMTKPKIRREWCDLQRLEARA